MPEIDHEVLFIMYFGFNSAKGSILVVQRGSYRVLGIEPGLAVYKASVLSALLVSTSY